MLYIIVVSKWRKKQLFTASLDHHCENRLSLTKEALFLPIMSFLQSFEHLCHVNCFQNKFDWKPCTMHKTSIFTAFLSQKMLKIAENRQFHISIFPKPIEMWLHGLVGVFGMGWSPFPPNMMARWLKTRKQPGF